MKKIILLLLFIGLISLTSVSAYHNLTSVEFDVSSDGYVYRAQASPSTNKYNMRFMGAYDTVANIPSDATVTDAKAYFHVIDIQSWNGQIAKWTFNDTWNEGNSAGDLWNISLYTNGYEQEYDTLDGMGWQSIDVLDQLEFSRNRSDAFFCLAFKQVDPEESGTISKSFTTNNILVGWRSTTIKSPPKPATYIKFDAQNYFYNWHNISYLDVTYHQGAECDINATADSYIDCDCVYDTKQVTNGTIHIKPHITGNGEIRFNAGLAVGGLDELLDAGDTCTVWVTGALESGV